MAGMRAAVGRGSVLGVLALVFGLAGGPVLACETPGGASGMRNGVIAWMNSEREARGLAPLRASSALQNSAMAHACDMAERNYFGHQGAGGPSLTQRLRGAGYRFRAANENIAKTGGDSVERAVSIWRNSPGHMANVLDPKVREVGVGLAVGNGSVYWVTNAGTK